MAYVGESLSLLLTTIEDQFSIFFYPSFDTVEEVTAYNYFSDGALRGMQAGDAIFAVLAGIPYLLYVESAGELACTATPFAFALMNGSMLPTSNPGPGSGLFWNNGGVVCVA